MEPKMKPYPSGGILTMETPHGGDYYTCPLCEQWISVEIFDILPEGITSLQYPDYCPTCKIIFNRSCQYRTGGCTDGDWFVQLVKSFKYKGKLYEGMPLFENYEDVYKNFREYQFNFKCTCSIAKAGTLRKCSIDNDQ
jgi:hypothetical protein